MRGPRDKEEQSQRGTERERETIKWKNEQNEQIGVCIFCCERDRDRERERGMGETHIYIYIYIYI